MYSFRVILGTSFGGFSRVADPNDIEWDPFWIKLQNFGYTFFSSFLRMDAAPNGAESKVGRSKQNVFSSGGTILNPKGI